MISVFQRIGDDPEMLKKFVDNFMYDLRVSMPGIVESFDPVKQTVVVRPAIREKLNLNGKITWEEIPLIPDVPVYFPRAGGYVMTMPIQEGDECLLLFADSCIDAWYQCGGVQNQIERRRHDLSDACALVGVWSQPRIVSGYSTDSAQLRNESGSAYVEIKGDNINMAGNKLTMTFKKIQSDSETFIRNNSEDTTNTSAFVMNSSGISRMNGNGNTVIDGKQFLTHRHTGVESGPSNTGGVA